MDRRARLVKIRALVNSQIAREDRAAGNGQTQERQAERRREAREGYRKMAEEINRLLREGEG